MTETKDNDPHNVVYNGVDAVSEFVSTVKVHPSVTEVPAAAFQHCRYFLWKVELPEGLVKIGSGAFSELERLEMINIPSTVTEIGERAFYRCYMMKDIILPQGLLKMGKGAFGRCGSLTTIHIPPLIRTIEAKTFSSCTDLYEVVLPVNLQEIKESAFYLCKKLTSIDLPPSLRILGNSAFDETNLEELHLPDSLEVCGSFGSCKFPNFRIPSMITNVDMSIFQFDVLESDPYVSVSIELPEDIKQIIQFPYFYSVRSMAIPNDCILDIGNPQMFHVCRFLQGRFDDLPLHKICYYHSYHDIGKVLSDMGRVGSTNTRIGKKLFESGKHQDCLGMTPLHILACSTKHHLETYQLLVERYPETLVTEDRWGCVPFVYALWCNAPDDIIEFLLESYKSRYPEFVFDWESVAIMLAQCNAPLRRIYMLLDTYKRSFPDQQFDLRNVVRVLESTPELCTIAAFRILLSASLEKRLEELDVRRWSETLDEEIDNFSRFDSMDDVNTRSIYSRLARYESYKEVAYLLELALWKNTLANQCHKKVRTGNQSKRTRCRIACGADIVIPNVLLFLWEDSDRPYNMHSPILYRRTLRRWELNI